MCMVMLIWLWLLAMLGRIVLFVFMFLVIMYCVCVFQGVKREPPQPSAAAVSPPCDSDDKCLVCRFPYCTAVYGAGDEGAFNAHQDGHL